MRTLYALCGLLLIIAGCKSPSTADAPASFSSASEKGLAIGTITFEGDKPVNDIYRFFYEPASADKKSIRRNSGRIMIKPGADFNGDFNNKKTYLFVIEAEPGSYAFTQYNYLDHFGPMGSVSSSKKFSIPFEIKKGEIAYIGELSYIDKAEKGTPKIFVAGRYDRDKAEFIKKFPHIDWSTAADKTVKAGTSNDGLIEFL
jgi:hypothetical protein